MATDMTRKRLFLIAPLAILGIVLVVFLSGEIVKLLWNWLLPPLFDWRSITFWQAAALLALCRILFGSHGWRGGSSWRGRRKMRERMAERWQHMTPEERERMRNRWKMACGFEPPANEPAAPGAPQT
jgi:hypothetical protein